MTSLLLRPSLLASQRIHPTQSIAAEEYRTQYLVSTHVQRFAQWKDVQYVPVEVSQNAIQVGVRGIQLSAGWLDAVLAPRLLVHAHRQLPQTGSVAPLPTVSSVRGSVHFQDDAYSTQTRVLQQLFNILRRVDLASRVGAEPASRDQRTASCRQSGLFQSQHNFSDKFRTNKTHRFQLPISNLLHVSAPADCCHSAPVLKGQV